MSNYEIIKKYAKELLDIALEANKLEYYLSGTGVYKIDGYDMQHSIVFPVNIIMETVYEKYKSNPELNIDKLFYEAIEKKVLTTRDGVQILNFLSDIEYQMSEEKENRAPFKIDNEKLLRLISENIKRNIDLYREPIESLNLENGFIEHFENRNVTLEENYGHKIL